MSKSSRRAALITDGETLGGYIRTEREKRGITLRRFAEDLEISPSYLSKVERGFETPSQPLMIDLIDKLHLDQLRVDMLMKRLDPAMERVLFRHYTEFSAFLRRLDSMDEQKANAVVRQLTLLPNEEKDTPDNEGSH